MNVLITIGFHTAIVNMIAWVLQINASKKEIWLAWEKVVNRKGGEYTFGDMIAVASEDNLRSLLKSQIEGRNPRYTVLANAFKHVTPRTPICLNCYSFGLVVDSLDFIELAAGRHTCKHCGELLEVAEIETDQWDPYRGIKVSLDVKFNRDFGEFEAPISEADILKQIGGRVDLLIVAELTRAKVGLVWFVNAAAYDAAGINLKFPHPRELLTFLAKVSVRSGIATSEIKQIANAARRAMDCGQMYTRRPGAIKDATATESDRLVNGNYKKLANLLLSLFSKDEFSRMVLWNYRAISPNLPNGSVAFAVYITVLVDELEKSGEINGFFFELLRDKRPRRVKKINVVARLFNC